MDGTLMFTFGLIPADKGHLSFPLSDLIVSLCVIYVYLDDEFYTATRLLNNERT